MKNSSEGFSICPFSLVMFGATSMAFIAYARSLKTLKGSKEESKSQKEISVNTSATTPIFEVVFILGGPGSGKGTQCEKLTKAYKEWAHLSAGDLLRAERKKTDSELADIINDKISNGQIVPSEITTKLIQNAMMELYHKHKISNFLIDGFPRNDGNVQAWNNSDSQNSKIKFVLYFDCPEEIMTSRLLERGLSSGRNDDKLDVIRKRFKTYRLETMPIIEMYEKLGLLKTVSADRSIDDIFLEVSSFFSLQ